MNKEEQFKEFIKKYKNENFATLVELVSAADFDVCGLADYLHTHRTKGSVVSAIQELARKEAKKAKKKAIAEEQRAKQVTDPLAEQQEPAEPTIKEDKANAFMCMCFIPTDVKQAIQDEMERRAENDPTLKAFLPEVSYTDVYNRIAAKLQDMAKSAPRDGGVTAVHFSDADTYALAEYLIRNQLTEREKAEKAKAATPKPAEKKKDETKPSSSKAKEKVVSMIPTNASQSTETKKAETKKKNKPKEQDMFPSLFDF